jgi:hypothetical protein
MGLKLHRKAPCDHCPAGTPWTTVYAVICRGHWTLCANCHLQHTGEPAEPEGASS